MADRPSLTDLLNRVLREGDVEAKNELTNETWSQLRAEFARMLAGWRILAGKVSPSDVLQEVLCDITSGSPAGTAPVERGRAYLLGCGRHRIQTAVRRYLTARRNANLEVRFDEVPEQSAAPSPAAEVELEQAEFVARMRQSISELGDTDRKIIQRTLSHPDEGWATIAAAVGLNTNATKQRYRRAILRLAAEFRTGGCGEATNV